MNGNALNVPATDTNTTGGQYAKERFVSIRYHQALVITLETLLVVVVQVSGTLLLTVRFLSIKPSKFSPAAPGIPTITTVNNDAGISISRFTGTGSASSFATGLNKPADFVVLKGTSFSDDYRVYHRSLDDSEPEDYYLIFQMQRINLMTNRVRL